MTALHNVLEERPEHAVLLERSKPAAGSEPRTPETAPENVELPSARDGRCRAVIEEVSPEINGGRYPIKRVPGEKVTVEAEVLTDGHDLLSVALRFRHVAEPVWLETTMESLGNDRWRGVFSVTELGEYRYTVEAWVDHFKSWRSDLEKKLAAGADVSVELMAGARLVADAAGRADGDDARLLHAWAKGLSPAEDSPLAVRARRALDEELAALMLKYPDRRLATTYRRELRVAVDPVLARTGAWDEMFPRSCAAKGAAHGTFKDVEAHLPRLAEMGFDVLYLPPIHPIGRTLRKGKNNNPVCRPEEPGSPWGIGAAEGGHKAIHPQLGTLADFRQLVKAARERKLEIALDLAFQCSPDHPYVKEHPGWFRRRPDGSVQYAENPPKKYQDIYPLDFECDDWRALWQELKSVVDFWLDQGVRIFRVDNPHTKALGFWEWLIGQTRAARPDVIFLAEAFTRPKLMYALAKLGFNQSYNYFPWRNTKAELTAYLHELARPPLRDFFRPNFWPNTPDILPQYLQYGGRPAFIARLVLAATLGPSYGIYGPAFELCANQPREEGSEEYLDAEKFEIRSWDLQQPGNLTELISRVNHIRRENPALQTNDSLTFQSVDNEQLLAYTKAAEESHNVILTVVNLDPHHVQNGWLTLSPDELGIDPAGAFQVHDLLTGERYLWHGARNYVQLDPAFVPAAIFRLRRRLRTERDFDYFL